VQVSGECDPRLGWLVDYADISTRFDPIHARLDHRYLNDVDGLDVPTLENVAAWIRERLKPSLDCLTDVHVAVVGACVFRLVPYGADSGPGIGKRVRFGFEAAHRLPNLPEAHKCRRMHGHSFMVDVAATDLASAEGPVRTVYDALDHTCLNEIQGLENATSENLSRWIWERLNPRVRGLEAVVVAETCTARCVYRGR